MEKDIRFLNFWYAAQSIASGVHLEQSDLSRIVLQVEDLCDEEENFSYKNIINRNELLNIICDVELQSYWNKSQTIPALDELARIKRFVDNPEKILRLIGYEKGESLGTYSKKVA